MIELRTNESVEKGWDPDPRITYLMRRYREIHDKLKSDYEVDKEGFLHKGYVDLKNQNLPPHLKEEDKAKYLAQVEKELKQQGWLEKFENDPSWKKVAAKALLLDQLMAHNVATYTAGGNGIVEELKEKQNIRIKFAPTFDTDLKDAGSILHIRRFWDINERVELFNAFGVNLEREIGSQYYLKFDEPKLTLDDVRLGGKEKETGKTIEPSKEAKDKAFAILDKNASLWYKDKEGNEKKVDEKTYMRALYHAYGSLIDRELARAEFAEEVRNSDECKKLPGGPLGNSPKADYVSRRLMETFRGIGKHPNPQDPEAALNAVVISDYGNGMLIKSKLEKEREQNKAPGVRIGIVDKDQLAEIKDIEFTLIKGPYKDRMDYIGMRLVTNPEDKILGTTAATNPVAFAIIGTPLTNKIRLEYLADKDIFVDVDVSGLPVKAQGEITPEEKKQWMGRLQAGAEELSKKWTAKLAQGSMEPQKAKLDPLSEEESEIKTFHDVYRLPDEKFREVAARIPQPARKELLERMNKLNTIKNDVAAMYEKEKGYFDKVLERAKKDYRIDAIIRYDLGQTTPDEQRDMAELSREAVPKNLREKIEEAKGILTTLYSAGFDGKMTTASPDQVLLKEASELIGAPVRELERQKLELERRKLQDNPQQKEKPKSENGARLQPTLEPRVMTMDSRLEALVAEYHRQTTAETPIKRNDNTHLPSKLVDRRHDL